ncbi:MAG: hypothetical protein AAGJ94_00900 [Pseudomonadota bacterium]
MPAQRRILTPIAATLVAGAIVGAATLGGTMAGDKIATKSDRFAVMGDNLCDGQSWPNLTQECLAWVQGEPVEGTVRFVTISETAPESNVTTLTRVRDIATN